MPKELTEQETRKILREGEQPEKTVRDVCHRNGISESSYYRWRRRYRATGFTKPKAKKKRH